MNLLVQKNQYVIHKMLTHFDSYLDSNGYLPSDTWVHQTAQTASLSAPLRVQYSLDDQSPLPLHIGMRLSFKYSGTSQCTSCQKVIKKIINGFCYVCLHKKAAADWCVMSPHLCHYANNTCREPTWGESFCFQPHYLYISYTDKYKVGITRQTHLLTRWTDQGATMAAVLCMTTSRHQAGMLEKALTQILADKSHWQKMLKAGNSRPTEEEFNLKLQSIRQWLHQNIQSNSQVIISPTNTPLENPSTHPAGNKISFFDSPALVKIEYPVPQQPEKIKSISLEKEIEAQGTITGIKGQYIFFGERVLNMRNHEGFIVDLECYD